MTAQTNKDFFFFFIISPNLNNKMRRSAVVMGNGRHTEREEQRPHPEGTVSAS